MQVTKSQFAVGGHALQIVAVVEHVEHDAEKGRRGSGRTDQHEIGVRQDTHDIGHGQTDEEGLDEALDHDEEGLAMAVEVAHEAEEHIGENGIQSKATEELEGPADGGGVGGKDSGHHILLLIFQK